MQEVESLCTSAIMIHKGQLLFSGPTDEIIAKVLGSTFLILEAEPLSDDLIKKISNIPGVEGSREKNPTAESPKLKIEPGKEVRPLVAEAVIKSGSKLYSMNYEENLMERTYIEALKQGKSVD